MSDSALPPDLIPADVRARLKDLRLVARHPSRAHGFGLQSSRNRGAGMEFAQYRTYEPGDDPRQIDWKLLARSDRYYVREAERDSPFTVWLLIDTSASMAQADRDHHGRSRLSVAKTIAACVFELAVRQGDRFGLATIGGTGLQVVTAAGGPRQRDRCTLALHGLSAQGEWPARSSLTPLWAHIAPDSMVLLLSDLFDDAAIALAQRLAATRREVISLGLLTAEERDFPFRGGFAFRDPETGNELRCDGDAVRAEFLDRFHAARTQLAANLAGSGIRHLDHVLDQAPDAPLRRLFGRVPRQGAA